MTVFDLFSKRQKKLRGEVPDVYTYDTIPPELRVQIVHIWHDALGDPIQYNNHEYIPGPFRAYEFIVETLCREYGLFAFPGRGHRYEANRNYLLELNGFLLQEEDTERVLDAVELSCRCIDKLTRTFDYLHRRNANETADTALAR